MTELKADRVIIKDLLWEIAQALADKHPEHWAADKVDSDLSLRRTIVAAMNQHGWAPDGIPGIMPHIFKELKQGEIKAFSTFNGLPFTDEEELVGINPANWWITTEDAYRFKKALGITMPAAKTRQKGNDWSVKAREIADECFDADTNGMPTTRDSLHGYSERVMEKMQEQGIGGPRGIITNPNTIKREALQGKQWWANKKKC
jgi:hypothetical protein